MMATLLQIAALLPLVLPAALGPHARLASAPTAHAHSCGAGKDLVVQALERLQRPDPQAQLADANQLLKRASDLCSEFGDAWYYRSLVEAKLGHQPVADYASRQARLFPSDALAEGLNPFILATPSAPQQLPPIQQRWALIIGIGKFSDTSLDLQYTRADAQAFRDVLVAGAFPAQNIRLVTDQEATLAGIKKGINWLARSAQPDDLAVVYIASHGSAREDDTAGANYILTHDTDLGSEPDKIDADALYATALPMVELANAVATRLKSRRTAIFLDTCYSGGAITPTQQQTQQQAPAPLRNASVSTATLERMGQGSGRIIFAASRTDQQSLESPALKHGYFTYYLVEALKAHPAMPLSDIFNYVQQHVSTQVATDYRLYGRQQNPVLSRSNTTTDFPLTAPPTTASLNHP